MRLSEEHLVTSNILDQTKRLAASLDKTAASGTIPKSHDLAATAPIAPKSPQERRRKGGRLHYMTSVRRRCV
jgi:hypothetical protein